MEYVRLGRSDLTVSRLALGCMSYGDPAWRPWVLDEPASQPFFRKAIESGINFFDTANMYSRGRSEEVTGRALKAMARREEVVIATKVFYAMGDGTNSEGLSRTQILEACDASLRRLDVDVIDLYQIHRFDPAVPIEETLEALTDLVRAGKVRYIGASSTFAWRMALALATSDQHGWARFISMQNHYNLIYREEEREMNPMCVDQGVGVIPWSPLARGLLTRPRPADSKVRGPQSARAASDNYSLEVYDQPDVWGDWDVVDAVDRVARARGVSMSEISLAWLLSRPGVAAPVVGATKLDHLDAAIRSLSIRLTAEEVAALEAPYRPHPIRGHDY